METKEPVNQLISTHKLDFEIAYSIFGQNFKIGTCRGLWGVTPDSYYILSIINNSLGNGHVQDVFEWFEHSCQRDKRNLLVLEIMNQRFYKHLIEKRGFKALNNNCENVIKIFNQKAYKDLLINGNEIIYGGSLKCK